MPEDPAMPEMPEMPEAGEAGEAGKCGDGGKCGKSSAVLEETLAVCFIQKMTINKQLCSLETTKNRCSDKRRECEGGQARDRPRETS